MGRLIKFAAAVFAQKFADIGKKLDQTRLVLVYEYERDVFAEEVHHHSHENAVDESNRHAVPKSASNSVVIPRTHVLTAPCRERNSERAERQVYERLNLVSRSDRRYNKRAEAVYRGLEQDGAYRGDGILQRHGKSREHKSL